MLQRFYNLSLQRKQMLIIMLISAAALLLACAAFVIYDALAYRREMATSAASLAEVVGNNTTAAIEFNDSNVARQTLAALAGVPKIQHARVRTLDGATFATYSRDGAHPPAFPHLAAESEHRFTADGLLVAVPIFQGSERVGTIELVANLSEFQRRLWRYAGIVAFVFAGSLVVAFFLSLQLGRLTTRPVQHLAQVVQSVTREKNYSARAQKQGADELGQLIDGFNEMLTQIQHRDTALQAARETLELRVTERTQELARSLSLLNATLDSTADGIVAIDLASEVTCANTKFRTMWSIPAELLERGKRDELAAFMARATREPEKFLQRALEIIAQPDQEAFDVIDLADGRVFERYIHAQCIDGRTVGRVINFRDITARQQAAQELAEAHEELVDASRRAGMAEVATGVLHNVGNVLNSVNVASGCVAENIRKSRAANLTKVVALLREHEADLGEFFTQNPKGKQLLPYLAQLAEHISVEQGSALKELAEVQKHIDHIKDIVAMQQSFARFSGMTEIVAVPDLVEDALRMNASALARHDVRVVKEFEDVPPITVEKHKVLQILVNLVTNAKQACDAVARDDKQLTLKVRSHADRVHIAVADNGVGIPPENLTRIFAHGFTTKKNGHGFGLHSGALAAKELGGALRVESAGIGHGTVFTLELPLKPRRNNHA
jgi:PAS domain S-box-containing protein